MKRRILSICLALVLCSALLPAAAWAADEAVSYGTVYVGNGTALTNSEDSPVVYAVTDENGAVAT